MKGRRGAGHKQADLDVHWEPGSGALGAHSTPGDAGTTAAAEGAACGAGAPNVPVTPDGHLERVCLRNLLALSGEAIYFKDLANRFILVSRGVVQQHAERLARLGRAEEAARLGPEFFIGKTDMDVFDEALALSWMAEEQRMIETGEGVTDVLERDAVDNSGGWFRTSKGPLRDDDGRTIGTFGVSRDVTGQVRAEQAVAEREAELRAVVDSSPDAVAFYDQELRYCYVNAKAAAMVGAAPEVVIGRTDAELGRPDEVVALLTGGLERALSTRQMCEVEYSVEGTGRESWFQVRMVPHMDAEGSVVGVVAATRDLTELKEAQAVLAHQALHDPLTGAANRLALMDHLQGALASLEREPGRVALLFIDLDNFKLVNDARGHDAGDRLLVEVASRLSQATRGTDTVARLGGDEFVVLLERLSSTDNAYLLADRVLATLGDPFSLGEERFRLTASVGVAVTSDSRADPGELLREADLAMYRAKQKGRDRVELFHPMLRGHVTAAKRLAADLRKAVAERQFSLLYQPLYALGDTTLVGVEALARWRHPTMGVLGPEEFISLAEELDLIGALGSWVLGEACGQLARWKASLNLGAGFYMAVNVSARQLASSEFVGQVAAMLEANQLELGELCLEITEAGLLEERARCGETLDALVAMGARLSLDDFGAGYSSLAHLHAFRVNTLKIDRSFVERLGGETADASVVAGVVAMAHALGMSVVAEGVETEPELFKLTELGCDEAQGFLFAKPLTAEAVTALLAGQPGNALTA